ncbi:hypothetical protein G7Y89_g10651 [Cudoniella acicularis]|uniref:1-(5-phosphoribosyl)-5-[(5-phosphoribosylamino)methylideneamino] imidazole-4-carboxamide isomerase n=1 Tax=Cudoniella acicularis TaxID=354080 RepID=A0A8H4REN7_9HELO|nr:hypothetical protein G7Y89_g10651 [Cudoniella acicularis]
MTKFRPCIDLHSGQVKQIVGGTLTTASADLKTNYVSKLPAGHFAKLYKENGLEGAHVIMLGPGNEEAAKEALAEWKGGLQVGGGITDANAKQWIDWSAERVIITSFLFPSGKFSQERLDSVLAALGGDKEKLVIDLSCRKRDNTWFVAMNKWQTITDMEVNEASIKLLEPYCSEFLIHAADNEGLQKGIDEELVEKLAEWCSIPVTYAGGGRNLQDLDHVKTLSKGRVDLTIGSALDIFGGAGVALSGKINSLLSNPIADIWLITVEIRVILPTSRESISGKTGRLNTLAKAKSAAKANLRQKKRALGKAQRFSSQAKAQWEWRLCEEVRCHKAVLYAQDGLGNINNEFEVAKLKTQLKEAEQFSVAGKAEWKRRLRDKIKCYKAVLDAKDKFQNIHHEFEVANLKIQLKDVETRRSNQLQCHEWETADLQADLLECRATNIWLLECVRAKEQEVQQLLPLAQIGVSIRSRYLEHQSRSRKNKAIIERGNQAAHYGDPISDALLFQTTFTYGGMVRAAFKDLYSLEPEQVLRLKSCKELMVMLMWHWIR